MAGTTIWRGCGRVPSQMLMATVRRPRITSRSGGPATGRRNASSTAPRSSGAARGCKGSTTVVRSSGRSTVRPLLP